MDLKKSPRKRFRPVETGSAALLALGLSVAMPGAAAAQDNTWVTVNPTFTAPAAYPGAKLGSYNAWACTRYRAKTNSVLAWRQVLDTRRKDGIYANGLVEWNLSTNSIVLRTASNYAGGTYEPMPSFTLMPEFLNDTTPAPRHTYDGIVYAESTDAVYLILGAMPRVTNYDNNKDPALNAAVALDQASTWKYTFSDNRWHRIPSSIRQFWGDYYCPNCVPFHDNHLTYWPSGNKLVFVSLFMPNYGKQVAEFDLKTEQWSKVTTTNVAPFNLDQALTTWDSKREAIVFRNGTKVCRYTPATKTFTGLPDCGVDADSGSRPYYTDIEYIPAYDVYFVVGKNGLTRVFDNANNVWITVSNDPAKLGLASGETSLYLEFDPSTGKIGLTTTGSGTFGGFRTFRYVPSGTAIKPGTRSGSRFLEADGLDLAGFPTPGFLRNRWDGNGGKPEVFSTLGRKLRQAPVEIH